MGELIRICGWCKKDLDEIQDKTRKQIPGKDRMSHGLCRACGKSVFDFTDEDLDEFEKEEISNADCNIGFHKIISPFNPLIPSSLILLQSS